MSVQRWLTTGFLWLLIALAVALSFNALSYINFDPQYGFLKLKQQAIATGWYLPAYYSHVLVGGIILLVGFFQFSKRFRTSFRKLHRCFGYIYIVGILLLAAPGGMIMAFFINRGPVVLSSFLFQCTLWFYFTVMATRAILNKDIAQHEQWTTRSYSLTLAAITLRIYIFIASFWLDLTSPITYGVFAWISWLPNLFVAEAILRKKLHVRVNRLGHSTKLTDTTSADFRFNRVNKVER